MKTIDCAQSVRKQKIPRKTAKKHSNIDCWKCSQLNAMALSMNLRSIFHIPGHGRPDFSKKTSILLLISSEKCTQMFSPSSE
jgi:hypothetical protein